MARCSFSRVSNASILGSPPSKKTDLGGLLFAVTVDELERELEDGEAEADRVGDVYEGVPEREAVHGPQQAVDTCPHDHSVVSRNRFATYRIVPTRLVDASREPPRTPSIVTFEPRHQSHPTLKHQRWSRPLSAQRGAKMEAADLLRRTSAMVESGAA